MLIVLCTYCLRFIIDLARVKQLEYPNRNHTFGEVIRKDTLCLWLVRPTKEKICILVEQCSFNIEEHQMTASRKKREEEDSLQKGQAQTGQTDNDGKTRDGRIDTGQCRNGCG